MAKTELGKKIENAVKAGEKLAKAGKDFKKALESLKPPDQPAQT